MELEMLENFGLSRGEIKGYLALLELGSAQVGKIIELSKEKQQAEIFVGTRGIMAMLNTIIDETKPEDDYFFFATNIEERNEEIQEFFKRYDIKRKERELNIRGLAPKTVKHLFAERKALKMKFPDFPVPSDITICGDKVALIAWEEKPIGYLIRSKQIYKIYKKFFEEIWNKY